MDIREFDAEYTKEVLPLLPIEKEALPGFNLNRLRHLSFNYVRKVYKSKHAIDFENLKTGREKEIEAMSFVSGLVDRRSDIKNAIEEAALEPARHDRDTSIFAFAEAFIKGEIRQIDFENEIFHRVLDREIDTTPELTFTSSIKDNQSPNTKEKWPVRRFQNEYLCNLFMFWCSAHWIDVSQCKVNRDLINFIFQASKPALKKTGEKLKEKTIENKLPEIKQMIIQYKASPSNI